MTKSTNHHSFRPLYVLIACEESQAETKAFRALGHIAYSCDLQKCGRRGNPDWHIVGDVTPLLQGQTTFVTQSGCTVQVPGWDLIIAHPPCTYICRRSAMHVFPNEVDVIARPDLYWLVGDTWVDKKRYANMQEAVKFFHTCLEAQAPFVAVENPLPLRIAELPPPSCSISPHEVGSRYSKQTCYWLKNLPPLMPTIIHPFPKQLVRSTRGKYRSRTDPHLAAQVARQWGDFVAAELAEQAVSCP